MAANFEYPILRPTFESRQLYAKAFFVVNDNFWHQTGGNFDCELDERRLLHLTVPHEQTPTNCSYQYILLFSSGHEHLV